ncbi:signal peptide peptidase SppA [Pseudomonas sp. JUb42]|uniref:S49 family peptidase n=1 Tax=Pseudomonas sp. JUb42 TaxID=2940611 RepID=UPI002167D586|nr:S49 family peptidase [Pseudomonas sp. JUb42]MCS3467403.1 signal peptide peptidase SppA [Pseudomonas sp. JUb42]
MKHHLRAASLLFNQPLLTTPDMLDLAVRWANQTMSLNIINLHTNGFSGAQMMFDDDDRESLAGRREEQRRAAIAKSGTDVIPVSGVLVSRGSHLAACETMTSYEDLRRALNRAVADPMVEHIVLDIDSPGGSAVGAFELAADIRAATRIKPITGLVNFMAYSGGYLIAAACTEVVVSQTSGIGSIGVIGSHMDRSKMAEGMGVKVTTVFAGAHKNDLSPHEPINEQSLQVLTEIVQESYQMFTTQVADYRNRDVVEIIATEAACYRGAKAIEIGLADRLEAPQQAVDNIARAVSLNRQQRHGNEQSRQRIRVQASAFAIQSRL